MLNEQKKRQINCCASNVSRDVKKITLMSSKGQNTLEQSEKRNNVDGIECIERIRDIKTEK